MNVVIDPRRQKLGLVAITAFNVVHATILADQLAKRNPRQPGNSRFHTVWVVFEGESAAPGIGGYGGSAMTEQPGFFDSDERLKALSAAGGPLERLAKVVDFEVFRGELEAALSRSNRAKGGRPPYDPVLMFKVLVLQTLYTLSDDQT